MRTYDLCGGPEPPRSRLPGMALAQFLELRGRRVFEAFGVLWGHYRGPFYCSLPYQLQIDPEPGEIRAVMRRTGIRCLRFPSQRYPGLPSGLYVCRPRQWDFDRLHPTCRRQIQRGLDHSEIRPVDPLELLDAGLPLNLETMRRQQRFDPEFGDPAQWRRFVEAVRKTPGMAVMGAYLGGRLATYTVTFQEGEWLHLLYKMSDGAALQQGAARAVDCFLIRNAARDPSIRFIENSFVSVRQDDGLDAYKRRMGFSVAPLNLAVWLHPLAAPLVANPVSVGAVKAALRLRPGDGRLELGAKLAEGVRISMTQHLPVLNAGSRPDEPCQHTGGEEYSRIWRPYPLFLLRLFAKGVRQKGPLATVRQSAVYLAARLPLRRQGTRTAVRQPPAEDEALGLQPGDWVEVKSEAEIRATLDGQGKHRGMAYVPAEMLPHCGRQFRVLKRVEKIFLEESRQNRRLKNTVLLEGVHCQGIGLDCDRLCFLFWREAWLKRAAEPRKQKDQTT